MNIITLILTNPFSHWGILIGGTLIFFILGWLWYNPITPIGKLWGKYFPSPSTMPPPIEIAMMLIIQLLMGLLMTMTVVALWLFLTTNGLSHITASFFVMKMYMGFVCIKDFGHWYFERKPFTLILIGVGYWFVGILGVCGLLSYFL